MYRRVKRYETLERTPYKQTGRMEINIHHRSLDNEGFFFPWEALRGNEPSRCPLSILILFDVSQRRADNRSRNRNEVFLSTTIYQGSDG